MIRWAVLLFAALLVASPARAQDPTGGRADSASARADVVRADSGPTHADPLLTHADSGLTRADSVRIRALEILRALDEASRRIGRPDSAADKAASPDSGTPSATDDEPDAASKEAAPGLDPDPVLDPDTVADRAKAQAPATVDTAHADPVLQEDKRELQEDRRERGERPDAVQSPADSTVAPSPLVPVGERPAEEAARERIAAPGPIGRGPPVIVHMPPDSMMAALRNLEGYTLTEYRAASAMFDADSGRLTLNGEPSLLREGHGMDADSLLVYDQTTAIICGYGSPVLQGVTGDPVESDQVCYNVETKTGVALGARTRFTQGGTWFVHGKELYTAGNDRIYGSRTMFTSCDLDVPHYHFAAKDMKIVHDNIMVARDVTMHFGEVPVFWLPFMVQSMKDGRRSGLLTPSFGLNDIVRNSSGYQRQINNIGFFWAINDYLGSLVALDWMSQSYTSLRGELQYNWQRHFLRGNISVSRMWQAEGPTTFGLNSSNSWRPTERTTVQLNANYASSDFIRQYSFDPRELNQSINSSASINHRFDWGSVNLGATRNQQIHSEQVDWTLPSLSVSLTPITLFGASAGDARWYNNATWSGRMNLTSTSRQAVDPLPFPTPRDRGELKGSLNSSLQFGGFSLSQDASFNETVNDFHRDLYGPLADTALDALTRTVNQQVDWRTTLSYTQRLIGTSTFTPSLSWTGGAVRPDSLDFLVEKPSRLNMSARLATNIYGFWPGVGPFSAFRHRLDPSITYSFSPRQDVTDLQRRVFGAGIAEVNNIQFGLNQTWEAKYKDSDTTSVEEMGEADEPLDGAPRRLPQARKVTLLSINSSMLAYDFARRKEGEYGLTTTDMSHSLRSDLLRSFALSIRHDLFETEGEGESERRRFSPSLRSVRASFSLSSDSWIFQKLGLGSARGDDGADQEPPPEEEDEFLDEFGVTQRRPGSIMGGYGDPDRGFSARGQPVGTWSASLNYDLQRPRIGEGNQILDANVSFQPTEHWAVSWSSAYSLTDRAFADHYLTLRRDLHRWEATFNFMRAQNGNFAFRFEVSLRDNPEVRLPYRHHSAGSGGRDLGGIR